MAAKELDHPALVLQPRHVQVQIHPVDALDLERHVTGQDISGAASYRHRRLRSTGPTRPLTASGGSTQDPRVLHLGSTGAYKPPTSNAEQRHPPARGSAPARPPPPERPPHQLVGLGQSPVRCASAC